MSTLLLLSILNSLFFDQCSFPCGQTIPKHMLLIQSYNNVCKGFNKSSYLFLIYCRLLAKVRIIMVLITHRTYRTRFFFRKLLLILLETAVLCIPDNGHVCQSLNSRSKRTCISISRVNSRPLEVEDFYKTSTSLFLDLVTE